MFTHECGLQYTIAGAMLIGHNRFIQLSQDKSSCITNSRFMLNRAYLGTKLFCVIPLLNGLFRRLLTVIVDDC